MNQVHSCCIYVHFGKENKNSDYSENEKKTFKLVNFQINITFIVNLFIYLKWLIRKI